MKITIYSNTTGEILRSQNFLDDLFDEQISFLEPDEAWIEGIYDPDEYYFANNEPVEKPSKPYLGATWDSANAEWLDTRDANTEIQDLTRLRKPVREAINEYRGKVRSRYITICPGQEMVYLEKERQARDWLNTANGDIADFPAIQAEIGPDLTGNTANEVAATYVTMADQFRGLSAIIEAKSIKYLNILETEANTEILQSLPEAYKTELDGALP